MACGSFHKHKESLILVQQLKVAALLVSARIDVQHMLCQVDTYFPFSI